MFYRNTKVAKCKYQKESTKIEINKTKVVVGVSLPRKKASYIIPAMNCYPRNR